MNLTYILFINICAHTHMIFLKLEKKTILPTVVPVKKNKNKTKNNIQGIFSTPPLPPPPTSQHFNEKYMMENRLVKNQYPTPLAFLSFFFFFSNE